MTKRESDEQEEKKKKNSKRETVNTKKWGGTGYCSYTVKRFVKAWFAGKAFNCFLGLWRGSGTIDGVGAGAGGVRGLASGLVNVRKKRKRKKEKEKDTVTVRRKRIPGF